MFNTCKWFQALYFISFYKFIKNLITYHPDSLCTATAGLLGTSIQAELQLPIRVKAAVTVRPIGSDFVSLQKATEAIKT